MDGVPREICVMGVYLPPLLVAGVIGVIVAYGLLVLLTRMGIAKYLSHVMLVYLCLSVISTFIIYRILFYVM